MGVRERVPQLTAFMDGPRHLGGHVAPDAAREGELGEETAHAGLVRRHVGIDLRPGALEPGVRDDGRAAMPGTRHEQRVEVTLLDDPVGVGPHEVETRGRAPMAQEPGLDVPGLKRPAQEWVIQEINLTHRQVVRGPPPGVDGLALVVRERPVVGLWSVHGMCCDHGMPPGLGCAPRVLRGDSDAVRARHGGARVSSRIDVRIDPPEWPRSPGRRATTSRCAPARHAPSGARTRRRVGLSPAPGWASSAGRTTPR